MRIPGASLVLIGAPLGNYSSFGCTPILGTYTHHHRGNFAYRIWRCVRTLRPLIGVRGWRNRLGLPTPALRSLKPKNLAGSIVSIHGFHHHEWLRMLEWLSTAVPMPLAIEFNISCPNVGKLPDLGEVAGLAELIGWFRINSQWSTAVDSPYMIFKLPPIGWREIAHVLRDHLVDGLHGFNTIPTPRGGVSGDPLHSLAVDGIRELREEYPDATLIGGGGIYSVDDAKDFIAAGADHVAIVSALLNPFRWSLPGKIMRACEDRYFSSV